MLAMPYVPSETVIDSPFTFDIYHSDQADTWRFALGRGGRKSLIAIGLHPGLAKAEEHDHAIVRAQAMAARHGCDGFVVMNLCPVRASTPHDLPWSLGADAYQQNMLELVKTLTSAGVVAAWGDWDEAGVRAYLGRAREDLLERGADAGVQWVEP